MRISYRLIVLLAGLMLFVCIQIIVTFAEKRQKKTWFSVGEVRSS